MKDKIKPYIIYMFLFLFYLWIAYNIPYTHDDWDWGLTVGLEQLIKANVNSRYVGNFFEVIMTRSVFIKTIIMAISFYIIPVMIVLCIEKLCGGVFRQQTEIVLLFCSNILILTMSINVWQQTYGWVAGFSNFGISSVFMLIIFREMFGILESKEQTDSQDKNALSIGKNIAMFFLSLCTQLFLENLTLFVWFLSLVTLMFGFFKYKKWIRKYIVMFSGCSIGMLIMFSSNIYPTLLQTGEAVDGYRKLVMGTDSSMFRFVIESIYNYCCNLFPMIYSYNILLNCIIPVTIIFLIFKLNINRIIKICVGVWNILHCVFLCGIHMKYFKIDNFKALFLLYALFFIVIVVELSILFWNKKNDLIKSLLLWCLPPILTLPLSVIVESGPRLFFVTNVLLILCAVFLLQELLKQCDSKKIAIFMTIVILILVALMCKFSFIYSDIGRCTKNRYAIISNEVQEQTNYMVLPKYPHKEYLWIPDPGNEKRMNFFKEFYNIPREFTVVFDEVEQ